MILDELIKQYTGQFVEVAGSANAKFQCVDLANLYIRDCLGFPIIEWTNAQDFPSKAGDRYDYILNTPEGVPTKGDLVIFKSPDGVGHISLFVTGGASLFTSFDQNFPTGSPCKLVNHNYRNVLGWLHPKESMAELPANYPDIIHGSTQWDETCKALELGESKSAVASQVINSIGGYKSRITALEKQAGENQAELSNRIEQVSRVEKEVLRVQESLDLAIRQRDLYKTDFENEAKAKGKMLIELETANKTIETLREQLTNGTVTVTFGDLLRLFLNQKITIERKV